MPTPLADLSFALARIAQFKGKPLVIKLGGSVQDDPAQTAGIIDDIATLTHAGLCPIIVHGGGKAINAAMAQGGLTPRFVAGQRYTDAPALAIAERVLAGEINTQIVALLAERSVRGQGLTSMGCCVLHAQRTGATDAQGQTVDLGLVGQLQRVQTGVISAMCTTGQVPVIAPIALDIDSGNGAGKLNVNADLAAGFIAKVMCPCAFILISDTPGIRTNAADPASCASELTAAQVHALTQSKVIDGGMLPKVQACQMALGAGVEHVGIIDGRDPHALLAGVLAEAFPGTRLLP
jgi:acetylglutamate kinase